MAALDKAKIVVVGDSGVGKTSLVHLICHGQGCNNPAATIGCSVEVKLHEFRAGTPAEQTYFIELWDIGGSSSHRNSRSIFYNSLNGVILVHDLTNRKSDQNLQKWLAEVLNKELALSSGGDFDPEQFAGSQTPLLVVGTKADLAQSLTENVFDRSSSIAEDCRAEQFNLDCQTPRYLAPGSTNAVKLSKFFDKVIERRFAGSQVSKNRNGYEFVE